MFVNISWWTSLSYSDTRSPACLINWTFGRMKRSLQGLTSRPLQSCWPRFLQSYWPKINWVTRPRVSSGRMLSSERFLYEGLIIVVRHALAQGIPENWIFIRDADKVSVLRINCVRVKFVFIGIFYLIFRWKRHWRLFQGRAGAMIRTQAF